MRDPQIYDMQLASSQLQALVSHLQDATCHSLDPQSARRLHQAQALLYEVAQTLGVSLDEEDRERGLNSRTKSARSSPAAGVMAP